MANNTIVDNGICIDVSRGNGEIIVNNILISKFDPIVCHEGTENILVDHNLCIATSQYKGPHGVTGDPLFVDPSKGVYWLKPGSPAIGKGSSDYVPDSDFWGRPRPKDKLPDLGARSQELKYRQGKQDNMVTG